MTYRLAAPIGSINYTFCYIPARGKR